MVVEQNVLEIVKTMTSALQCSSSALLIRRDA